MTYTPDPRIVKYLREYDRDLGARWDADLERWWVTWRGKPTQLVQNNDGTYRPLDERAVTKVIFSDAWKTRSSREYMKLMSEHNHRMTAAEKARRKDDFRQYMLEEGHQKVFGVGQFTGWSPDA